MNAYAEIFPPGDFLKEELEARNWSQTEFAEIIGRPVRLINEIIAGKKSITPETAVQFGASLGTSAEFWLNLESQYQLSKVPQNGSAIQRKAQLYEKFPVREMIRRGWIEATDDVDVLECQFKRFFELKDIDCAPALAHAAKRSSHGDVSMSQWAWLHRVKMIATSYVAPQYSHEKLRNAVTKLKTLLSAAEELRHVSSFVLEAGVRFVMVEALPGSKIDGACLWLSGSQPVIAMSGRLDRIDNFWFVLRHEIEHVLRGHGKDGHVMLDEDIGESDSADTIEEERQANEASAQFAVTDSELHSYMTRVRPYYFYEEKLLGFSRRLGVHPGIVIGRLQKKLDKPGAQSPYRFLRGHLVKVRHLVTQAAPSDGWGSVYPVN
jgi:HTH-type transcriptional regulator/antitoxin HigA